MGASRWYRAAGRPAQNEGLTTIKATMTTMSTPVSMPPRRILATVSSTAGGGPAGAAPAGGGVELSSISRMVAGR